MLGLWIALSIGIIAFFIVVGISIKEMLHVKNKEYVCVKCEKRFSPNFSLNSLINFGDESKLVKCPHCGCKDRMLSKDEKAV
ncbi:MAG: hypothetical protein E7603_01270 [Ruminococcaceae bacterium]|nr:hypothetical protein [Oscillospiraceae bacterium]